MAPRKWRAPPPGREAPPQRQRDPDPDLAHRAPCDLCGREARGFGYVHKLLWDRYPRYRFCSMGCLDCGSERAARNNGMIDKTDMEVDALRHARRKFAEALTKLGLLEPFADRSSAEIDLIIEACVDGFRDGMQRQRPERDALNDPIAF